MKQIFAAFLGQFLTNIFSKKTVASLMLMFGALYVALSPMNNAADYYGLRINIGVISYVITGVFVCPVIFLSAIIIFSGLPVKNPPQHFVIARSGKVKWIFAQFLYVFVMSIIIVLLIIVFTCVICGGRISFSGTWGKLENAVASGQIPYEFGINTAIGKNSLIDYSPSQAFWWTIIGAGVTFMIFGWVSIVFNLFIYEFTGTVINAVVLLLQMAAGYFPSNFLFHISPIAWCSVDIVDKHGTSLAPDISYVLLLRGLIVSALIIGAFAGSYKGSRIIEKLERKYV